MLTLFCFPWFGFAEMFVIARVNVILIFLYLRFSVFLLSLQQNEEEGAAGFIYFFKYENEKRQDL